MWWNGGKRFEVEKLRLRKRENKEEEKREKENVMPSSEIKSTNFQNENSILSVCTRSNTLVPSCDGCSKLQQAMNTLCQHLEKLIFSHTLLRLDQLLQRKSVGELSKLTSRTRRCFHHSRQLSMPSGEHEFSTTECWKPFISPCRWCFDVSTENSTCAFDVFLHFLSHRSWWVLPYFQKCPYFSLISTACAFSAGYVKNADIIHEFFHHHHQWFHMKGFQNELLSILEKNWFFTTLRMCSFS